MLTFHVQEGYWSLNPGALELCDGSAIMLLAEHAWKRNKNERYCERSYQQSNSTMNHTREGLPLIGEWLLRPLALILSPLRTFVVHQIYERKMNEKRAEEQQKVSHWSNNQTKTNKKHNRLLTFDTGEASAVFGARFESSEDVRPSDWWLKE